MIVTVSAIISDCAQTSYTLSLGGRPVWFDDDDHHCLAPSFANVCHPDYKSGSWLVSYECHGERLRSAATCSFLPRIVY